MNNRLPDAQPEIAALLMERLDALRREEGVLELAHPDAKIRHSDAGKCSRAIQYKLMGIEGAEIDAVTSYTFKIGHVLHEMYQETLEQWAEHHGHEMEIEKHVYMPEFASAGHLDAHYKLVEDGKKITVEVKTINGTGYKNAIGIARSDPGPRHSALLQGAINAKAALADELKIVYLPLEVVSKGVAERKRIPDHLRACAEWTYSKEEYMPFANSELERFRWILNATERGDMVPKFIPAPDLPPKAIVTNPTTGSVVGENGEKGKTWQCDYCDFQRHCEVTP